MTDLLYLPDNDYTYNFGATVKAATNEYIVLDQTHFYPEGGGQPSDEGLLEWDGGKARVVDVQKDHGDVKHVIDNLEGSLPEEGVEVQGTIDKALREQHRRMHTAQHVMSKVVLDEYDAGVAGNQIHRDRSRIDFEPAEFSADDVERIEAKTNEILEQELSVEKTEMSRDEVEDRVKDGRTKLDLIPDHVDPLRVVVIEDFDICPCGGTHVQSLAEIGQVTITERTSKGADVERIEFELEREK